MRSSSVIFLMSASILAVPAAAPAADLHVDGAAKAGDGSKARPFPTITAALAAAHKVEPNADSGEPVIIHVASGTYKPKATGGKEDIPADGWKITKPLRILGSYVRKGETWAIKPYPKAVKIGYPTTVIDLGGGGRAFLIDPPKLKPVPRSKEECDLLGKTGQTVTPSVRLQGIAIHGGRVEGDGGAVLSRGDAPLEVLNCDFEDNQCTGRGGAVCAVPADRQTVVFFRQCVFKNNAATRG
ncbi:MAG TPA: hypothetical protein VMZ50_02300, partial [Phycisphaerae bacterium]|nr:hypothetical protein [Phycisphaerae bacterium]